MGQYLNNEWQQPVRRAPLPHKQVNQWIIVTRGRFHSEDLKDFRSYPIDD